MGRRSYTLSRGMRTDLEATADAVAFKLVEGGLDREDANELVGVVVGGAMEALADVAGAPDQLGDLVAILGGRMAEKLAEMLKPDPEAIFERAKEALKAGDEKRARRLFSKAARVLTRQGEE